MSTDLRTISLEQIQVMFPSKEIDKAYPYVKAVSKLMNNGNQITANVQGSERSPYHVNINHQGRALLLSCSCPVGNACKHVAATLLSVSLANKHSQSLLPSKTSTLNLLRNTSTSSTESRDSYISRATLKTDLRKDTACASVVAATLSASIIWNLKLSKSSGVELTPMWFTPTKPGDTPSAINSKKIASQDLICAHLNRNSTHLKLTRNFDAAFIKDLIAVFDDNDQTLCMEWFAEFQRTKTPPCALSLSEKDLFNPLIALAQKGHLFCTELFQGPIQFDMDAAPNLSWLFNEKGLLSPHYKIEEASWTLLDSLPPLALCPATGKLALPRTEPIVLRRIMSTPLLDYTSAIQLAYEMGKFGSSDPKPSCTQPIALSGNVTPVLALVNTPACKMPKLSQYGGGSYPWRGHDNRLQGSLSFNCAGVNIPVSTPNGISGVEGVGWVNIQIPKKTRLAAIRTLAKHGMVQAIESFRVEHMLNNHAKDMTSEELEGLHLWRGKFAEDKSMGRNFLDVEVKDLQNEGWIIKLLETQSLASKSPVVAEDIQVSLVETGNWFDMDIGVMVNKQRFDLAPILANLFSTEPRWLSRLTLDAIDDNEKILIEPEGERPFTCLAKRIKPFALHMADLILRARTGPLKISTNDADELERVSQACQNIDTTGLDAVKRTFNASRDAWRPEVALPPKGLVATLRPYQQEGLNWMAHLARHNLAGILADDMGLGKTIQCLAHLLREKELGYTTLPSLVVLPTSLVFNWMSEATRFTPSLRVLALCGSDRHRKFEDLGSFDLVITTYPLLWRDIDAYRTQKFHLVIADEAQNVKNIKALTSGAIRELNAKHKLCLTGTPIENNLSELHAQFDFLLPGYLGSASEFKKRWANPIEKQGRSILAGYLAAKIKPFLLRRMKEQVASELPPKSIAIRSAQFANPQRDLYESVRSAMDARVRQVLDASGLAKSQIIILDALLKLRQVCNDPSLCPTPQARLVKESAKMELLKDMIPELLAQKRKILIFSQFTSMLAIIEAELVSKGIAFSKLTGQTKKRETQIRLFQDGTTDVFLISLKAGGAGLNLTEADTVIHVDPWWNPAAENQATDRAHRIGQTKPVLVLKLIIEGSIEEKILALQARKAQLADGILVSDADSGQALTREDIEALFAPMPDKQD